ICAVKLLPPMCCLEKTIRLASGDQKASKAAYPGGISVSGWASEPSGFIVETLQQPPWAVTKAILPLGPGKVARAGPTRATRPKEVTSATTKTISRLMASPPSDPPVTLRGPDLPVNTL